MSSLEFPLPITNDPVLEEMVSSMKIEHPQFFEGSNMTAEDYQGLKKDAETWVESLR